MSDAPATAYVGIGSNLEPERYIPAALDALDAKCPVLAVSAFYRTAALHRPELPDFVNGVCAVQTTVGPRELKYEVLREVEAELGRARGGDPYGSRTIDLDLLLVNGLAIAAPGLTLPDPDIRERPFVAFPLLELAPDLVLPDNGERLAELPVIEQGSALKPVAGLSEQLHRRFGASVTGA
jgi:2-amino-4-hydroxy-6-hydroxymethyldihydropteridine diphosphokinase